MNDNRPERSCSDHPNNRLDKATEAYPRGERVKDMKVRKSVVCVPGDWQNIQDQSRKGYQYPHRLPPRSTDAIQPVRLGRREIERVHVLMGILDRRSKK